MFKQRLPEFRLKFRQNVKETNTSFFLSDVFMSIQTVKTHRFDDGRSIFFFF